MRYASYHGDFPADFGAAAARLCIGDAVFNSSHDMLTDHRLLECTFRAIRADPDHVFPFSEDLAMDVMLLSKVAPCAALPLSTYQDVVDRMACDFYREHRRTLIVPGFCHI